MRQLGKRFGSLVHRPYHLGWHKGASEYSDCTHAIDDSSHSQAPIDTVTVGVGGCIRSGGSSRGDKWGRSGTFQKYSARGHGVDFTVVARCSELELLAETPSRHGGSEPVIRSRMTKVPVGHLSPPKLSRFAAKLTTIKRRAADFRLIGIGGCLSAPPLPHHRTCGSASGGSAG